jgi:hypothetical protein
MKRCHNRACRATSKPVGTAVAIYRGVKNNDARKTQPGLLPFGASLFALVFAIIVIGNAVAAVLLDPSISSLSEEPDVARYFTIHMIAGGTLFAAGVASLVGLERRSEILLLLGQLVGGVACAAIVALESMSLWAMPYLE